MTNDCSNGQEMTKWGTSTDNVSCVLLVKLTVCTIKSYGLIERLVLTDN